MKIFLTVLLLLAIFLFLSFCVFLFLIKPNRRRGEIEKYCAIRYAHRGLHNGERAENSLSAFAAAVEKGYAIELDVRLSSDGELVVFHDDTLDRVTKESGKVCERTAKELSKIHLNGTADTIPTLKEVLSLVDGKVPLLVEIKEAAGSSAVAEKTAEVLSGYRGEFIIESFNPMALSVIKKRMPSVLRGVLSESFLKEKRNRKPIYFVLQCLLLNFVCRPDFIAFNHRDAKNAALRFTRGVFGVPAFAWTVRSEEEEKKARENGFDTVIFENYLP